jgi:hypothetical protein
MLGSYARREYVLSTAGSLYHAMVEYYGSVNGLCHCGCAVRRPIGALERRDKSGPVWKTHYGEASNRCIFIVGWSGVHNSGSSLSAVDIMDLPSLIVLA